MAELTLKRRRDGTIGLMGHVVADFPSGLAVRSMIAVMAAAGAEVIEIQIPFSEPMADGPTFLAANHKALAQGVNYDSSIKLMYEMSARHPDVSFVFMTYLNVVFKRGYDTFAREAEAAGARGVIIPDLPYEYAQDLDAALSRHGLTNVRLIPPNASGERFQTLCAKAGKLIYAVARSGVTGGKTHFGAELKDFLTRIRERCDVPIAVGFGVRNAADIKMLRGLADLAIIGTASLETYERSGLDGFEALWQSFARAAT